jgi:hypothetical protein
MSTATQDLGVKQEVRMLITTFFDSQQTSLSCSVRVDRVPLPPVLQLQAVMEAKDEASCEDSASHRKAVSTEIAWWVAIELRRGDGEALADHASNSIHGRSIDIISFLSEIIQSGNTHLLVKPTLLVFIQV